VGAGRAFVACALAAVVLTGCGGDDEPAPLPAAADTIDFATPDFKDGGAIPAALTCDGEGKPPTLTWRGLPSGAIELVLLVDDADAEFTHWTAYGIPVATGGGLAPNGQFTAGTKSGKNSSGKNGWAPPCPPEGDDAHTYRFALYAIPEASGLEDGATPEQVRAALKGAVGRGTFTGTYAR
jgi:Raf kinase inhibitor-like YbhB/YbcL family protein